MHELISHEGLPDNSAQALLPQCELEADVSVDGTDAVHEGIIVTPHAFEVPTTDLELDDLKSPALNMLASIAITDATEVAEQASARQRRGRAPAPHIVRRRETDVRGPVLAAREQLLSDDLFKQYLREIGEVPLLDAEQEVELAKRIEGGLYAGRLARKLEGTDKEPMSDLEKEAIKRAQIYEGPQAQTLLLEDLKKLEADGQRAKGHMIEANLRLVVSVAKRYTGHGMALLDLVQEGNAGLIRGVEKFDYAKGFKFSTYATWWIRQAITRAMADQARTIRIPVHMVEKVNRITRIRRDLLRDLGREPTDIEVAAKVDMPLEKLQSLERISSSPVSLNKPLGDGGGTGPGQTETTFGDLLGDEAATHEAENSITHVLLAETLEDHLTQLNVREAKVMRWRYGLDGDGECTLQEIGDRLGITRERARQIETKAMGKLQGYAAHSGLRDFLS